MGFFAHLWSVICHVGTLLPRLSEDDMVTRLRRKRAGARKRRRANKRRRILLENSVNGNAVASIPISTNDNAAPMLPIPHHCSLTPSVPSEATVIEDPRNAVWQVRKSPRILPKEKYVPTIPKSTRSDDPIWRTNSIPNVNGLVVESDDGAKVYLVPRSHFGKQVYTAKHLHCRHCVLALQQSLFQYLSSLTPPRAVLWYDPTQDHADAFFVILNLSQSVMNALGPTYPFEALHQYTANSVVGVNTGGQASRQTRSINRGFFGTQGMTTRDSNGHPVPTMKSGTRDPVIVKSIVAASMYLAQLPLPWNRNTPIKVPIERTEKFASKIGNRCLYEGVSNTVEPLCVWHRDMQNPPPDETDVCNVTTVNATLDNGTTITSVYYFRYSVSINLRTNTSGIAILRYFGTAYRAFPPERRSFTAASTGNGRGFRQVLPNLDPLGFHNLFHACTVTVVERNRLNLFEALSLVVAAAQIPNSVEPYARACMTLLRRTNSFNRIHGYRVGFVVFQLMMQRPRTLRERYSTYRNMDRLRAETTDAVFLQTTNGLFWTVLHVWSAYPTRPSNATVHKVYLSIRDLVKSLCYGFGNLIALHVIEMMAEFGFLPRWLQTYATFDPTGIVFQWYARRFQFPSTQAQARRLMAWLPTGLEAEIGTPFMESLLENLACKNVQRDGGARESKRDIHYSSAPIFVRTQTGDGLAIVYHDGRQSTLEGDVIVYRWRFGASILTMAEIASELQLASVLPSLRVVRSMPLPDEARRRSRNSDLSFEIDNWYL
jgi:hypothetical protein